MLLNNLHVDFTLRILARVLWTDVLQGDGDMFRRMPTPLGCNTSSVVLGKLSLVTHPDIERLTLGDVVDRVGADEEETLQVQLRHFVHCRQQQHHAAKTRE